MSSYEHRIVSGVDKHRIRYRVGTANKAKTFATKDQALNWKILLDAVGHEKAVAALTENDAATIHQGRTVAEQVAHHITTLPSVSDGTRRRYKAMAERRINTDPIGALPLELANRDDYTAWVTRMLEAGLSAKTVRNHHSLVSDALRSAVRSGKVQANHAEGIRIETPDHDDYDEMVVLTDAEVIEFVTATPEHWRPMVIFMFGTGVRWQEASALKVRDVDLERQQARIQRAWKDTGGAGHQLGKPKSKRSRRTIVFEHGTAAAIRSLVEGRKPDEFVFTNTRGGPVRYSNFSEQAWAPGAHVIAEDVPTVVKPARGRSRTEWGPGDGKRITPHGARHTYASRQIRRGKGLAFIQRQLGHEQLSTTNEIYGHLDTSDLHNELGDGPRQISG